MESRKVKKQVVGIDISKDSFYVCYIIQYDDGKQTIKGTKSFKNTISGMIEFLKWCQKRDKSPDVKPVYIMEATGVYYEGLAYFLYEQEQQVSVQLAQKIKYFAKSCNLKTKTDKVDSKMISQFGIEKNLGGTDLWIPPSKEYKIIRDLAREHTSLKQAQTAAKCQLHAFGIAHETYPEVIEMKKQQIEFYKKQIAETEKQIEQHVASDSKLHSKVKKIATTNGIGLITIIKVLTETNGFLLFKNIRQLVSYAGLDVIEKESGTFVGKTKISKKGNARIRAALYMPAMSAIQCNSDMKTFYERINEKRTIKKQGLIAVMRKLLIIIYTLWKKDEEYIINYQQVKASDNEETKPSFCSFA